MIDVETTPKPWDPGHFKADVLISTDCMLTVLLRELTGGIEAKYHGRATHRLADADLKRVQSLGYQLLDAIGQARIVRACGLQIIEGGKQP